MSLSTNRRNFIAAASALLSAPAVQAVDAKPALLGGPPLRTRPFPSVPIFDHHEEKGLVEALRSARWGRLNGQQVNTFEQQYAKATGAEACLATTSGTASLLTSLGALDIGPGDEVLVPPYTFVATVNVVLLRHALPVFIDTDPATFLMDAAKIEAAITPRTRAIIPVHIGGSPCDMDAITAVARKHKLAVIEDACQAWVAQWRGRNVGLHGDCGCFSFQASKNITSGEGGAIISTNRELIERCYSFHNQGRGRDAGNPGYTAAGANLRMTEFQAAILRAQLERLDRQSRLRSENAAYLTSVLREIDGIVPARMYPGATRNAWHLFMFSYDEEKFQGLPKSRFVKALAAEGVPVSGGYKPLNQEPLLKNTLDSRGYRAIYSESRLKQWHEQNHCPNNDRVCDRACWFSQYVLLADRAAMDQIAAAILKIKRHASELNG